ncbi:MAG: SHOCT domain-containing protein [Deltaproteobacteria bacterium]
MGKFFSRFRTDSVDPEVKTFGNMANFYSLLIFLIAVPFVLIIGLVWLTGIMGFNTYIFAGFACEDVGADRGAVHAFVIAGVTRPAAARKDELPAVLVAGADRATLEAPALLEAQTPSWLPPERFREELEGFLRLRDEGVISSEEFDRLKASLLQRIAPSQAVS